MNGNDNGETRSTLLRSLRVTEGKRALATVCHGRSCPAVLCYDQSRALMTRQKNARPGKTGRGTYEDTRRAE